jgi:hypothetical protein
MLLIPVMLIRFRSASSPSNPLHRKSRRGRFRPGSCRNDGTFLRHVDLLLISISLVKTATSPTSAWKIPTIPTTVGIDQLPSSWRLPQSRPSYIIVVSTGTFALQDINEMIQLSSHLHCFAGPTGLPVPISNRNGTTFCLYQPLDILSTLHPLDFPLSLQCFFFVSTLLHIHNLPWTPAFR